MNDEVRIKLLLDPTVHIDRKYDWKGEDELVFSVYSDSRSQREVVKLNTFDVTRLRTTVNLERLGQR